MISDELHNLKCLPISYEQKGMRYHKHICYTDDFCLVALMCLSMPYLNAEIPPLFLCKEFCLFSN